jgi:thioredoxin-like negative regulator of GroEL
LKVYYFTAPWCQPCKQFGPTMDIVQSKLAMDYEKVNIQDNTEYIEKFNLGSVPTVLVAKDGVEVGRMLGATTEDVVMSFIGKYA